MLIVTVCVRVRVCTCVRVCVCACAGTDGGSSESSRAQGDAGHDGRRQNNRSNNIA